jgi:hypothetical protein
MTELDQAWSQMLTDAALKAGSAGRRDVAEYLRLKATNDAIRSTGVGWLIDTFMQVGSQAMVNAANLTIDRDEPHTFPYGNSTMVGTRLTFRRGVRSMTVEAGWARGPRDGIMRGGALAFARISHFGMSNAGVELRLVFGDDLPSWLAQDLDSTFDAAAASRHVSILLQ